MLAQAAIQKQKSAHAAFFLIFLSSRSVGKRPGRQSGREESDSHGRQIFANRSLSLFFAAEV
jgi:hypothetical protein